MWFNYGPEFSLRQQSISFNYHHFFQKLDREWHAKLIERQLFDSVEGFLSEHNIDTTEFRGQGLTVVNHGVFITGDAKVSSQAIAAGPFATASSFRANAREEG